VLAQGRGGEAVTALQGLFAILLVVALVALGIGWHFSRSNALLHKWADENDFQILVVLRLVDENMVDSDYVELVLVGIARLRAGGGGIGH
jgi:hypothetical protein